MSLKRACGRRFTYAETVEPKPAMRILVVEDEPRLQRNLAKALREEGYAVDKHADAVVVGR